MFSHNHLSNSERKQMTGEELLQNLRHFDGSDSVYYYKPFGRKMSIPDKQYGRLFLTYSEGMAYLFKNGQCYWLLDQIFASFAKVAKSEQCRSFAVWKLIQEGSGANLVVASDSGVQPVLSINIEYTDFKAFENGVFKFYSSITQCGEDIIFNVYLPQEY